MSDRDRELIGRLLEAGRETPPQPSDFQRRAGWSRLQRALPGAVVAPQIDVPPAAVEAAAVGKVIGASKLLGIAGGVGWVGKAVVAGVLATTIGTVGVIATQQDARRDAPARSEPAPVSAPRASAPVIEPAIVPAVPPTIVPVVAPAIAEAIEEAGRTRVRGSKDHRAQPGTGTGTRAGALDSESALIAAAHRALAGKDLRGALALLDDHAARYPTGSMSEDREALRVVTLCRSGDARAAKRVRTEFFRRWPDSMHSARVRAACADGPTAP